MPESPQPVVLVVEDDPDVAETFALWLEDYDVRRAGTGEEALERIDDTVDVVLLDRKLPGIDGGRYSPTFAPGGSTPGSRW